MLAGVPSCPPAAAARGNVLARSERVHARHVARAGLHGAGQSHHQLFEYGLGQVLGPALQAWGIAGRAGWRPAHMCRIDRHPVYWYLHYAERKNKSNGDAKATASTNARGRSRSFLCDNAGTTADSFGPSQTGKARRRLCLSFSLSLSLSRVGRFLVADSDAADDGGVGPNVALDVDKALVLQLGDSGLELVLRCGLGIAGH